MAQKTQLTPLALPGQIQTFLAKVAAALNLVSLIGSTVDYRPSCLLDESKSLGIEGSLEIGNNLYLVGLPVADPSVVGQLWNDGGILKVSAG